jgi:hypothetical protein
MGDHRRARELYREGVELSWRGNMRRYTAPYLHIAASLAIRQGDPIRSARLWGAAEAMYEAVNTTFSPVERQVFGPYIAMAREGLDEAAWEAARAEGRAMTSAQAVAYALEDDDALSSD